MSAELIHELVSEMLGRLPGGRGHVGVDGDAGHGLEEVARRLVDDMASRGTSARVVAFEETGVDIPMLEDEDVVVAFGEGALNPGIRSRFGWTLWVEATGVRDPSSNDRTAEAFQTYRTRDEPKSAASAIIDVSDPSSYRRDWNDACSV
ncbi:hypothetical protein ACPEEZ_08265 [Frigoribacterium sp. 2-23]|uniref:hypothetical protein n=1 Tax=Frigoribacterium sp. 2-23 TaxID=3415006 RepID=UPI003C6FAACD